MNKALWASYGRSLLATILASIFAVGKLPFEMTSQDWYGVANAVWIAVIPVAIRFLNPNDQAFGITKDGAE
jgi:hypothetical protein